jgi:hypothetical protein
MGNGGDGYKESRLQSEEQKSNPNNKKSCRNFEMEGEKNLGGQRHH